ncbi:MAG: gas vesicle protein K, partial [Pseudanabaena sp. ELA748]
MTDLTANLMTDDDNDDSLIVKPKKSGLAPLILTLVELLRQLMEAQIIRRMDAEKLTESEIERAADSLQAMEQQIFKLCEVLDIDPEDLKIIIGIGTSIK